jgi:hypothetical protein
MVLCSRQASLEILPDVVLLKILGDGQAHFLVLDSVWKQAEVFKAISSTEKCTSSKD